MMLNIQYWTILVSLVSDIQHGPSIPADKQLIQHQTSLWSLVSKKMNGLSLTQPLPEFSEQRYSCSSDTVTQKRVHLISSRLVEFREEICAAVTSRSILDSRGCRDYPECLVMCSGKHFSKSRYAGEGEEQLLLTFAATLLTRNISTAECNSASLSNLLNMGDNN